VKGFLEAGCPSCNPTNSVKALKESKELASMQVIIDNTCIWKVIKLNDTPVNDVKQTDLICPGKM